MHYHNINLYAVLVSVGVSFLISSLWYSPFLFGQMWLSGLKKNDEEVSGGKKLFSFLVAIVGAFAISFLLAHVLNILRDSNINHPENNSPESFLKIAIYIWFTFIALIGLIQANFERMSYKVWFINSAFRFVEIIAISLVLYFYK